MNNSIQIKQKFFDSLKSNDIEAVTNLVKTGKIDINAMVGSNTPISYAVIKGSPSFIKKLIELGADVNGENNFDILTSAIYRREPEIVQILLENGVDTRYEAGMNHLKIALQCSNLEVINLLLERGADVASINNRNTSIPWGLLSELDEENTIIPKLIDMGLHENTMVNNDSCNHLWSNQ